MLARSHLNSIAIEPFDHDDYADADAFYARRQIERFNRASHSDALREMQLEPAEEVQRELPLVGYRPSWATYAGVAAFTFIVTIVGVHSL